MKKKLAILNLLSVLLVITVNGLSQAQRWNNTTIGEVSNRYDNLFTPAGYAFSIWGVIFLGLLAYAVFGIRRAFFSKKDTPHIEQAGFWFTSVNVLNALWVVAFTYDYVWLSVFIIIGMLFCLLKIVLKTYMERWDAPIEIIAFVWWPICIYSGWVAVAVIANISAFLVKLDLAGSQLTQIIATMTLITIAVFINLLMINLRNMREFAMVGAWALFAIFIRHKDNLESVAYFALLGTLLLVISSGLHGYRNRETNPINKLKERFKS
ncbi:tryptophan-rich sensory protein [Leeuwenhoekiella sp. W20_SRS_FM14]|uniref:tryptophan-rich sensory protein n=1 Tax=Leeuwenhoekiella sp. W20_SRS_FM14 TaxID=3240270 RepID=UPI003F9521C8